ncbi:MAG: hypothetical protein RIR00_1620 [Pseudomonadota bacterium]|jgi:apolipoprotein N-acyltransferase
MPGFERWRAAPTPLLAFSLGATGVLAFAPFEQGWLLPVLLAGQFGLLQREVSWQRAAFWGWCFGFGFLLFGVSWVYVSLSVFGGMPPWLAGLATLLFCAALAGLHALQAGLFRRFFPAAPWRRVALFAGSWAAMDLLRGHLFTGFPWLLLGYSQSPASPLAGFAPWLGVYGLSLLLALIAGCLWLRWRGWALAAAVLALGAGLQRIDWAEPVGAPLRVALIQGNISQDLKWQPEEFVRTLLQYRDLVREHPAQLTVLPETALPSFLDRLPAAYLAELESLARRQGGDLLLGVVTGQPSGPYWNSAVSLGTSPSQTYGKRHLVPFGEFIPPGFAWFLRLAQIPMSDFSQGASHGPLHLAGQRVAVNICYEDAFGEELIAALPEATLLVNLSNTAWFGRSLAQPQHLQIARMRALETARPMLRATNTGMTAVISPRGEVSAVLPAFTTGVLQAEVQGYGGTTPYVRWGNLPVMLLTLAALGLALFRRR